MKKWLCITVLVLFVTSVCYAKPGPVTPAQVAVWNQQLTTLDQQYKNGTIVYADMLAAKKAVLVAAGFTFNGTDSAFSDFSSFVDTKIQIMETSNSMKVFRRSVNNEAAKQYGLGHWYGGKYESLYDQRMDMAVLEQWNNPMTGMYWIEIPAGQLIITGSGAAFTEPDGTVRPGGPAQYWLLNDSKEINGWLVYALYSPAYLESYASALNAAQLLSDDVEVVVRGHVDSVRRNGVTADGIWASLYGSQSSYTDNATNNEMIVSNVIKIGTNYYIQKSTYNGNFNYNSNDYGVTVGWDAKLAGKDDKRSSVFSGVFFNYGNINQTDSSGTINNVVNDWRGGAYLAWQAPLKRVVSPYLSAELAFGRNSFSNTVNSWSGGSAQNFTVNYSGNHFVAGIQGGLDCDFGNGWLLQPQLFAGMDNYYIGAFGDGLGATVNTTTWNTGLAGAGLKLQKDFYRNDSKLVSIWLDTSAASRLGNAATISVTDETASAALGQYIYTAGGGGKLILADGFSVQVDYLNTGGAYSANSLGIQLGKSF
ncbi:MAG: autotransporter outer membrane beta-barrel domain-containing protein [Bacillota bacterium]